MYWALGVVLFVHCVNFMGVAYFGQIVMLLNLQLAMVASLPVTREKETQPRLARKRRQPRTRKGPAHRMPAPMPDPGASFAPHIGGMVDHAAV
jgi:hypothetical protein